MNRVQAPKQNKQKAKVAKKAVTAPKRKVATKKVVKAKRQSASTSGIMAPITSSIAAFGTNKTLATKTSFFSAQTQPLNFLQRRKMSGMNGKTLYTKDHEYIRFDSDSTAFVGISNHAQELLGEIVYLDLPSVDREVDQGAAFAAVESVKASNDVYAPVSFKVLKINDELANQPGLVNEDPEGNGWLAHCSVADTTQFEKLMDKTQYASYLETCDH